MILIFGGTTEGKTAVEVCEQAEKPFYYSTKSALRHMKIHNGMCLFGAMSSNEISTFCKLHDIRCIIDAAHPFAMNLHKAIEETKMPVIRLQRIFPQPILGVVYCNGYEDAMRQLQASGCRTLLALSGVNTICKLKEYWTKHRTFFRILDREESINKAIQCGFPKEQIILYNDDLVLPSIDEEKALMESMECDAILTKESGEAGGFDTKVKAAQELGLKVFVIKHPLLSKDWEYVTGKYGLRRAIERIVPDFFTLKTGLTTGACATAATTAALRSVLYGDDSEEVCFCLPDGEELTIPVVHVAKGVASVIKDFSDDPDITRGCKITATVTCHNRVERHDNEREQKISFLRGSGVGIVTLPGLDIPVGEPAVNPTPRRMMTEAIKALTDTDVDVTISVEGGEELAKKTFNERVGVVSGISIIGTSGIVQPLSNDAFICSIRRELEVAWAIGCREIGFVAGMRSEKLLKTKKNIRCVHYGNFIGEALKAAYEIGFRDVDIAIMIGKAVKLAAGNLDTHSHKVVMDKEFLVKIAVSLGIDPSPIYAITMARELWNVMPACFFKKIEILCRDCCMTVFPNGNINIHLICNIQ